MDELTRRFSGSADMTTAAAKEYGFSPITTCGSWRGIENRPAE